MEPIEVILWALAVLVVVIVAAVVVVVVIGVVRAFKPKRDDGADTSVYRGGAS